ncbi:MAG: S8 family serine peptidase, partial [Actinobacteria bacterium]|nr:S8 family serine peptidase [Actinomycetota bacterium]
MEADRKVEAYELPSGIDRIDAELNTLAAIGGDGGAVDVDVAVIDTGVDDTHPDLNVVAKADCARGGPFNDSCREGEGTDGHGHGTHVAGT